MSSTTATRQRRFWLATSFLVPIVSLGISGAQAQQTPSEQLPPIEVTSPTDPNRTRAKPTYDEASTSRRVVPAAAPSTGTRPAAGTGSNVASQSASQGAGGSGGRQFSGIVGASATVITAEEIAHSPSQTLPEIIAQVPGVQLTSLYGGVNGAKTVGRSPRLRRVRDLKYPGPHQRPTAQRHRHGRRRSLDHSAQFDRAHRNHARQQRRGALRRQCGRRRHQYRPEERRRRPAGRHARGGRCRLLQPAHGLGLDGAEFGTVVDVILRQRHQVRRLSRQQRARPAQRRRQSQLHHARPQGLPDGDRRRPEARIPRRPHRRSLDRPQSNWSPTAGAPIRRSITATSRAPARPPASPRRS